MDTTEMAIGRIDTTKMKAGRELIGAEIIVEVLIEQNVKNVFGYPGGTVLPLYDVIERTTYFKHTLVSHEQGAVHAADGYARVTGEPGVVFVTSGPGATNTVTGIQTAFSDSSPLVVITGQVPVSLLGTDAFQECNITDITKSCTKRNYLVKDVSTLADTLREAFALARSGRPGPVLIDIPKDVQLAKGMFFEGQGAYRKSKVKGFEVDASDKRIAKAVEMMMNAERPVFYTGGGVFRSDGGTETLRELARETGFPVTSTLMGLGALPASDPKWLGMLGMHGTYEANMAMHGADLIVAIGARFDDRVTGALSGFAPNAKIVHIDINPQSIDKIVKADVGIVADCRSAMEAMLQEWRAKGGKGKDLATWFSEIDAFREMDGAAYPWSDDVAKPQFVLEKLCELLKGKDAYVVTDVGQNQMWAAQYLKMDRPNRFVTSGGLGTMGFGLPAAVGVKSAHPEATVVCICGDGGFHMTSGEMITAMNEGLAVKVLVLNNGLLGMVQQWNKLTYKNAEAAHTNKAQPDFVKLAGAYGWEASRCVSPKDVEARLRALIEAEGPALLECCIDPDANVLPMIRPGKAHNDMMLGGLH